MPDNSIECALGRLQADTTNMKDYLQEMREDAERERAEIRDLIGKVDVRIQHAEKRLRGIEDTILTARVSWRTVVFVGSACGAAISVLAAAAHYLYEPAVRLAKTIFGV